MLFPSRAAVVDLESMRARWDPVMAARIDAHLTLVHHVADHPLGDELLAHAGVTTAPFTVRLTEVARWGQGRGIYLRVDDPSGSLDELHAALAPLESPGWLRHGFRPHVTVVHGRYVTPEDSDAAWVALESSPWARDVAFDRVSVIEMDDDGWTTVAEVTLTGG